MSLGPIAFYMHDLSGGGVERMRLSLIAELRARGQTVSLVVGRRQGALAGQVPADLDVVELGCSGVLASALALARVLRRKRPDVLVASLDHNNIAAMLAGTLARTGTRVVVCQHNALSAERASGWKYRAVPWLYWLLQSRAHGLVAVSRGVADDLAQVAGIPRRRITAIYNPVIGPDFAARSAGSAPHPWLADGEAPTFVFAGRLTDQKDPLLLLEAFALLRQSGQARLVLLGEGPLLATLRAEAARRGIAEAVLFAGFQANPLPWIAHATGLVLSSRYEGLGNVLIEALACGTPVVATDCPHGPAEILAGGAFGALVPVGDAALLADAMARMAIAPRDSERLQARAACFSASACADAHLALLQGLENRPAFTETLAQSGKQASKRFFFEKKNQETFASDACAVGKRAVSTIGTVQAREAPAVFGLKLSTLSAAEITEEVLTQPAGGQPALVVTPNIDHVRLLRHQGFRDAYHAARIVCPDGLPVLLYARLRGYAAPTRVTGCELYDRLANHPELRARKLLVVVESQRTRAAFLAWAEQRGLPHAQAIVAPAKLAGDAAAQMALATFVGAEAPDILVLTLGAPLSETFVHTHRHLLPGCWALCVGQAVRVQLGLTERAPRAWQRAGLEWLWRIRQEPRRLAARYARALAWFPVAVARDLRSKEGLLF